MMTKFTIGVFCSNRAYLILSHSNIYLCLVMAINSEPVVLSEIHSTAALGTEQDDKQCTAVTRFYLIDTSTEERSDPDLNSSRQSSDSESDSSSQQPVAKQRKLIVDRCGDLRVPRRPKAKQPRRFISIRHNSRATPIADVGLQVWRGACLLCDWLLSQRPLRPPHQLGPGCTTAAGATAAADSSINPGTLILELGCGVGLVGVAAAAAGGNAATGRAAGAAAVAGDGSVSAHAVAAARVVLTDVHEGALQLAATNLVANGGLITTGLLRREREEGREGSSRESVRVDICRLDWFDFLTFESGGGGDGGGGGVSAEAIIAALLAAEGVSSSSGGGCGGGGGKGSPYMATEAAAGAAEAVANPVCVATGGSTAMADAGAERLSSLREAGAAAAAAATLQVVHNAGLASVVQALVDADDVCLLAADTVYDTALTEAFVKCAAALLSYRASARRRAAAAGTAAALPLGLNNASVGGSGGGGGGGESNTAGASSSAAAEVEDGATVRRRCSSGGGGGDGRLIVALEKRFNFTLRDMSVRASAFEDFMRYVVPEGAAVATAEAATRLSYGSGGVKPGDDGGEDTVRKHAPVDLPSCPGVASWEEAAGRRPLFRGRRLDVSAVPQVLQYERSPQLELWELRLL
ncbi:hypothetical protein Agub_g13081 [Astrephomene gubernaculifera]|uniref:Methyltransferase n=1 Tax=Astrephomene gubernaculifera TaxID=47775 RepID=A0AAD3HRU7_9CHLO|nr:hypothetical protein Agub_g13081 [Astrephomene gubernaculifera]